MKTRLQLTAAPKPAISFFDLEVLLSLVLQVLNIIARVSEIFGINLNFGGGQN